MNLNKYIVKIEGVNIDSTMQKIYKQKILLTNIKRTTHTNIEFEINEKDYSKIEHFLKNFEVYTKIVGIKSIKKYFLKTLAIWLVLPFILYFAMISKTYLWDIEINGLNNLKKEEIICSLKNEGVEVGSKIKLDTTKIENILLSNSHIAQASCYYKGTTLIINISEKLVYEVKEYLPICAKYDGIITNYELKKGTINFFVGKFIKKGDVLVYPYIIDTNGNKVSVEPEANIEAKIYLTSTYTIKEKEIVLERSGKVKSFSNIQFNSKKVSPKLKKPFVFYEYVVYNDYISSILPFVRQKIVFYELIEKVKINDLVSLKTIAEEKSLNDVMSLLNDDMQFVEQTTQSFITDGILYSTSTATVLGNLV